MGDSIHEDFIDLMDLLDFTLSSDFTEKWKHKYSSPFIKIFQDKLLFTLSTKPIKKTTLFTYLTKRCKYSPNQVTDFFESIDIRLYHPIIKNDK